MQVTLLAVEDVSCALHYAFAAQAAEIIFLSLLFGPRFRPRYPVHATVQSALFDFTSLLTVILLFICTCAYVRALTFKPNSDAPTILDRAKHGFLSFAWKCARIGERLSPWVAAGCAVMAFHVLFIK